MTRKMKLVEVAGQGFRPICFVSVLTCEVCWRENGTCPKCYGAAEESGKHAAIGNADAAEARAG